MTLPRLHVVTDDDVLARPAAPETLEALMRRHGQRVAVHLRGHGTPGRRLHELAARLAAVAAETGAALMVNDRLDVALAVDHGGTTGVQVGRRSLPVDRARALMGPDAPIGYSAHDAAEAVRAAGAGADFVILGAIWPTASHPGEAGAGVELVRRAVAGLASSPETPVLAIGGVTPDRVAEAVAAGAYGVAAQGGIWSTDDPAASAGSYLEALG